MSNTRTDAQASPASGIEGETALDHADRVTETATETPPATAPDEQPVPILPDTDADAQDVTPVEQTEGTAQPGAEPAPEAEAEVEAEAVAQTREPDDLPATAVGPAPEPVAQTPPPARKGGFVLPLLGGIIAAGIGFGTAQLVPQGWPIDTQDRTRITELEARLAALEPRLQQAEATTRALPGRIDALEGRLAATASQTDLADLRKELAALTDTLARTPVVANGADGAALHAQLEQLRSQIAAMPASAQAELENVKAAARAEREAIQTRAEAMRDEAGKTARLATARGALLRLQAAIETGGPLEAALADLAAAGITLPEGARARAAGVPLLSQLQQDFPVAARAAISRSHRELPADAGMTDRLTSFFAAQTGMRSLSPQDGDSVDAVLSRAEAMVARGDLTGALHQLDDLPPQIADTFGLWRAGVEARQAVADMIQDLTRQLQAQETP